MALDFSILLDADWTIVRVATEMDPPEDICRSIRANMLDSAERFGEDSGEDDNDVIHELADSSVPVYNADRIAEFASWSDAWGADLSEFGTDYSNITEALGVALFLTYEQAYGAVLEYVKDNQPKKMGAWVVDMNLVGYLPNSDEVTAFATWDEAEVYYRDFVKNWAERSDVDYEDHDGAGSDLATVLSILADDPPQESGGDYGMIIHANDGNSYSLWMAWSDDVETPDNDS
jgi:hypothetical protein